MPVAPGMWHLLSGWSNAGSGSATPDFFHLDGSLGGDLPETPIALVQPAEGRGIAGIAAIKRTGPSQPFDREYLVMEFSEPLVVGEEYTMSFEVTNGQWLPTSAAGLAVSGLGVAFSLEEPSQSGNDALPFPPTFQFSNPLYSAEWERFSFDFDVSGPTRYMIIGVFDEDEDLEAEVVMGDSPQMAYYFFDDFQLQEFVPGQVVTPADQVDVGEEDKPQDLESTEAYVPNAFSPNGDGLNDVFRPETGEELPSAFDIYSRWGERLLQLDPGNPEWDGNDINGRSLAPGVYIWRMEWPRRAGVPARSQQGAVTILH